MCELLAIYPCSCFCLPLAGGLVGVLSFTFLLFLVFCFFFFLCVYLKKISYVCGKPDS